MTPFFSGTRPGTPVRHGTASFELPILYRRDDAFALFFTAKARAVAALMPTPNLHPVRMPGGRALVGIAAFNYIDTSIGPYGEVAVVVPAVHGRRPLPVLPALMEAGYRGFGNLVLHLPVTGTEPRDAGRGVWGYTKFVADMRFAIGPEELVCRMDEEDEHILTLTVPRRGILRRDAKPLVTYSVLDGRLIQTVIPQRAIFHLGLRPRGASLELGGHQVARSIADLGLAPRPLMSRVYLFRPAILPAGEVVEEGVRPLDGYLGRDRTGIHEVHMSDGEAARSGES